MLYITIISIAIIFVTLYSIGRGVLVIISIIVHVCSPDGGCRDAVTRALSCCEMHRLHAGERWMPVTDREELAAGAMYRTFILPYEELPSRRYPAVGCIAYLFRHPNDPPDPRDRYFTSVNEF